MGDKGTKLAGMKKNQLHLESRERESEDCRDDWKKKTRGREQISAAQ